MKVINFIEDIKKNCSEITYLCSYHILNKIYKDIDNDLDEKENILNYLYDYNIFLIYLNDYAGMIYRKYNSSTQEVYIEICDYFDLSTDSIHTLKHIIRKLEKQTPNLLMSLVDEHIQKQSIENFDEKLNIIKKSPYYNQNKNELESIVMKLESNILLVKKALQW